MLMILRNRSICGVIDINVQLMQIFDTTVWTEDITRISAQITKLLL